MIAQFCEILVWVLVHSLWQGILIAGCVSMLLRWLPARRAEARYASCVAGLGLIVLSAMVTWSVLTLDSTGGEASELVAVEQTTPTSATAAPASMIDDNRNSSAALSRQPDTLSSQPLAARRPSFALRDWMPWIAGLWMTGACLMLVRTIGAIVTVRRWRTLRATASPTGLEQLQAIQLELCERLHLNRHVTLWLSEQVAVPAVIGTLWPCILIPPTLVASIPLDQWRVILAHELAHIRRYDALVNLVQMMVESLLFFNPAVWWVSRQIRVEREACCDALAAAVCGQPLSVARTLVEFAAGLSDDARWPASPGTPGEYPSTTRSTSVMAFADPQETGELTDRVQRLVAPEVAALPRVSWTGLIVVMGSLALTVLALHWGTSYAVKTAVRLMSPQERVAKLERLQTEARGVFLPPEPKATSAGAPQPATPDQSSDTEIVVELTIRTEDGAPVPKQMQLHSLSTSGSHSESKSLDVTGDETAVYKKTYKFNPCNLRISAHAEGYAAVGTPILSLFPDSKPLAVELLLIKGSRIQIQVQDEAGQPIAGASVSAAARLSLKGASGGSSAATLTADHAGNLNLDHVGDMEYGLKVRAAGFQQYEVVRQFKPAEKVDIRLKQATPVSFQVVDAATDRPVPQARFVIARIKRTNSTHFMGDPRRSSSDTWNKLGETDANGHANLDELQDGSSYMTGIIAPGFGMAVQEIQSGQAPTTIKLGPPLTLSGRVVGDLTRLPKVSRNGAGKSQWSLSYSQRVNDDIHDANNATVDEEGRFEIGNLVRNERVTLKALGQSTDFTVTESLADVVFKIPDPNQTPVPAPYPLRDVVIRLTGTSPNAPARGTLYINWWHADPAARQSDAKDGQMPLRGNEIHCRVPVGGTLSYRPDNLVGYRIDERDGIAIEAGTEAKVIEVPTQPAGGIHGTIVRADGLPAISGFITVFATQLPPGEKNHSKINPSSATAASTFLASLPLGGRYRVLAREFTDEHIAWVLSDEITLDESQPIAEIRLQLPKGRNISVKVLAPDGTPVVNQLVALNLEFSQPKGHSTSMTVNRATGPDGVANFEDMSIDASIAPLELTLTAEVATTRFIGWRKEINPNRPIEIRLERGLSASGVLIEAASGKPIPNAEVRLMPREFGTAKYRGTPRTKTDANGKFRFEGLEAREYVGYVDGSVPKGTKITPQPDGNVRFEYQSGVEQHRLEPGSNVPARWEVIIYPGSRLKTSE